MVTITTTAEADAREFEPLGTKIDGILLRLYPASSALPNPTTEMVTTTPAATEAEARESLGTKLNRLKEHAKDMASRHPVARAAAVLAVSAVGAYFLWPVAAPAAAVVMMKAPGSGGLLISRAAFTANPQLYYNILRTAGAAAAAAAFAA